ncbi:heme-degrading domain-containing protein [Homoserinibacter sp. GY 40078]|uniref:heme-degrading domain-containing protein n=1 Tax=Homoserinibacter sp. GY 40078 TaxID=2603275 RepID=UPI0011CBEA77|nr:heme-degrading domain-containing protein [Homoserinibacter sp. GY 40078]TXK17644.1 heme-degrading domain-containing protein [Homoserinibacter sp. GY 40078]
MTVAPDRSELESLLAQIAREETELSFPAFGHDEGWRLGRTIRRLARERQLAVAIDVRLGEQQVFHSGLPGSTADNDDWIARKVRTTLRFGRSSLAIRLERDLELAGFDWLDPATFAVSGGCVPIRVGGAIVGTATVSGLPDHEDHALVVEGLRAMRV